MKTLRNRMAIVVVFITSLAGMMACNNTSSGTGEKTSQKAETPAMDIFAAAFMGDVKAIKAHISIGTDLNQKDQYGSTPLIIATTFNKVEVARALIDGGACLSEKSADGSTALHTAAFFCRGEIVEYLLSHGADNNLTNNYGSTPLQSVSGAFNEVKGIYQQINRDLGPLGLRLDLNYLEENRPKMVALLK